MTPLLTCAYWPNLHYFFYVLNSEGVMIEQFENYQKQSFRNRTQILAANGVLDLTIPVTKQSLKELTRDIKISYTEKWQIKHWRAITSAYKNSPYFDYFESDIHAFYTGQEEFLLSYNLKQLALILKLLQQEKIISLTSHYEKKAMSNDDLRAAIHPKTRTGGDEAVSKVFAKTYYQTFSDKFEFTPNLSILDLLFNTGLGATEYLSAR